MDNFIGSVVFLLPGVLAYFWLQGFGINPVVKHSPTEFTAVAAILWLPVSFCTLILYNLAILLSSYIIQARPIWTAQTLKDASNNFPFLIVFLGLSVLVSFAFSYVWAFWGFQKQQNIVNYVRIRRGLAALSDSTSVWDEVFGLNERQVVEVSKIDKINAETENISITGAIRKASRTFEAERNLCLDDIEFMTKLVREYPISIDKVFIDTKAGLCIKIFNMEDIDKAIPLKEAQPISSGASEEKLV